jgi:hypothetical protein
MTFFSSPVIGRAAMLVAMGFVSGCRWRTILDRRCLLRIVGLPSD